MCLTLPQIIMLNHASWVNQARSEERFKKKQEAEKHQTLPNDPVVFRGKRVSELDSDEFMAYWSGGHNPFTS